MPLATLKEHCYAALKVLVFSSTMLGYTRVFFLLNTATVLQTTKSTPLSQHLNPDYKCRNMCLWYVLHINCTHKIHHAKMKQFTSKAQMPIQQAKIHCVMTGCQHKLMPHIQQPLWCYHPLTLPSDHTLCDMGWWVPQCTLQTWHWTTCP